MPMLVQCSSEHDPTRWCIEDSLFDLHFLSHADLQTYLEEKGLRAWTEDDDRKCNMKLSSILMQWITASVWVTSKPTADPVGAVGMPTSY